MILISERVTYIPRKQFSLDITEAEEEKVFSTHRTLSFEKNVSRLHQDDTKTFQSCTVERITTV